MATTKIDLMQGQIRIEKALRAGECVKREMDMRVIRIDHDLQSRVMTDPEHVMRLTEAKQADIDLPPVVVFHDRKDRYWLADGFHRVAAHRKLKLPSIMAYVFEGERREALLYSASANLENSKPTTVEDRKKAARLLLGDAEFFRWPDKEIGRRCGLGGPTVSKVRTEYCAATGIPLPESVIVVREEGPHFTPYKKRIKENPRPIKKIGRPSSLRRNPIDDEWFTMHRGERVVLAKGEGVEAEARENLSRLNVVEDPREFVIARTDFQAGFIAQWLIRKGFRAEVIATATDVEFIAAGAWAIIPIPTGRYSNHPLIEAIGVACLLRRFNVADGRQLAILIEPRWATHQPDEAIRSVIGEGGDPIRLMDPRELVDTLIRGTITSASPDPPPA